MGKGAELRVVSKRNQPIHSKDEQGEPSEEKIIPALRQATKRVWGICRNNVDYAQSYLRPFLILFPHFPYSVKISALSSETTLPKLQTSPGDAMCPFKVVSMLDFTDSRWKPSVLSYLFWVVQPFSVHRAEEERKFSSSTGFGFGFSPFSRRRRSTARSQPASRNSSLSLIETI